MWISRPSEIRLNTARTTTVASRIGSNVVRRNSAGIDDIRKAGDVILVLALLVTVVNNAVWLGGRSTLSSAFQSNCISDADFRSAFAAALSGAGVGGISEKVAAARCEGAQGGVIAGRAGAAGAGDCAADVAAVLLWTRRGRRFDELDGFNRMLATFETGAHLDLLAAQGRLVREEVDGVRRYR